MWESHYLFSNINFNSVSALRISILLLSNLKNLIIFFKIKPSLGINHNIILRINISMSKNTEAIDITKGSQQIYTINNTNICSDTRAKLAYSESNIKLLIQLPEIKFLISFSYFTKIFLVGIMKLVSYSFALLAKRRT